MADKTYNSSLFKRIIDLGLVREAEVNDLVRIWRVGTGDEKAITLQNFVQTVNTDLGSGGFTLTEIVAIIEAEVANLPPAVTIGTPPNGLSLAGQELSLGLASTSTIGALSNTDWNTFNVKIGGTIASGQVAFGSGVNTIQGSNNFTFNGNTIGFRKSIPSPVASGSAFLFYGLAGVLSSSTVGNDMILSLNSYFNGTNTVRVVNGNVSTIYFDPNGNIQLLNAISGTAGSTVSFIEQFRLFNSGNLLLQTGGTFSDSGNKLDVNGTTRIRTISNLGVASTEVLVPSATGVVSKRTVAQFRTDIGAQATIAGTATEGYVATAISGVATWQSSAGQVPNTQVFTYVSSNVFTLSFSAPNVIYLSLNGQVLREGGLYDWTVSGTSLTVSTPLRSGDEIAILYYANLPVVTSYNRNIDGGVPDSIYLAIQNVDGGTP